MIKADQFYASFATGFAETCPIEQKLRGRGRIPKYKAELSGDKLAIWFKVNGKASALPYQAGDFWPELQLSTLRHNDRDDGTVSWYQYTDSAMTAEMSEQQKAVCLKVAEQKNIEPEFWKTLRDANVQSMAELIKQGFSVGWPSTRLYYLDEDDAHRWGQILGRQLPVWLDRFRASPETLEAYMWRVHWNERSRA